MAIIPQVVDRVLETSTTTGTGTYTLAGAVAGYQSFAAVGNGNTCFYCAMDVDGFGIPNGGWEVGLGTYTSSGTTLARTQVTASSNSGSAVSWSAGTRRVFITLATDWLRRVGPILLDTQIASSSASLVFTSRINADFNIYLFELDSLIPATNAVGLRMRCSTDGGSSYDSGSNYNTTQSKCVVASVSCTGSATDTSIYLISTGDTNISNDTTHQGLSGWMKMYTPFNAHWKKFIGNTIFWTSGSAIQNNHHGSAYMTTSPVNAIEFSMTSGNITSGTIRMYGIP